MNSKKGKLIIVSAPSGAGKTTLVHYLLKEIPDLEFSVSCTTRPQRENETHGKDYYFITVEEFKEKIENEEFVEYEQVYEGLYYGTLKSEISRILEKGKNIIFDIDVQGGINLKNQFPESLALFILPPDIETLRNRLQSRNTESTESLQMRIKKSEEELGYQDKFDLVLINDDLENAQLQIKKMVENYLLT